MKQATGAMISHNVLQLIICIQHCWCFIHALGRDCCFIQHAEVCHLIDPLLSDITFHWFVDSFIHRLTKSCAAMRDVSHLQKILIVFITVAILWQQFISNKIIGIIPEGAVSTHGSWHAWKASIRKMRMCMRQLWHQHYSWIYDRMETCPMKPSQ